VEELKVRMGAVEGAVIPIVIGTRGAMPNTTVEALKTTKHYSQTSVSNDILDCTAQFYKFIQ